MRNVLEALLAARKAGKNVVYTALVETRGSTPQKAGASMLVYEDGTQVGTLGGGCVEAEVKRKALENLSTGKVEIALFQLDHDYGWDDGLICGGRMTMILAPVRNDKSNSYYERFSELILAEKGLTEAVVVDEEVGTPGSRYLVNHNSEVVATDGSGELNQKVIENLHPIQGRPRPYLIKGISYLPYLPQARLIVVGAGHVGRKISEYAAEVDFKVTVMDDREEYCNSENIPSATEWIVGDFDALLPTLEINDQTFCVIVTRGHNHDEEALFHLIRRSPKFLGMIGSKRKIRLIYDGLVRNGIDPELLEQVHAPIGLKIGSQTVPEIAMSIVAELIQHRNCIDKKKTPATKTSQAS